MQATFDQVEEAVSTGKLCELIEQEAARGDASGGTDLRYKAAWVDENGIDRERRLSATESDGLVKKFPLLRVRRLEDDLIPMDRDDEPGGIYGV